MNIASTYPEKRHIGENRVDTIKILIGDADLADIKAQFPEFTEVLEHYVVLYKPFVSPEEVATQKDDVIHTILAALPDSEALGFVQHAQTLKGEGQLVKANTRINWENQLFKANVDLWDNDESTPAVAPALWSKITMQGAYRTIPETITAELAFSKDEIGFWPPDGKHYKAKNDGTVWTPTQYADAWVLVQV